MRYTPRRRSSRRRKWIFLFLGLLVMLSPLAFLRVRRSLSWRMDVALTGLRGWINPVGSMPSPVASPMIPTTALPSPTQPESSPSPRPPSATSTSTPLPIFTPTPIPGKVVLPPPEYERQDWNNCGPAALSLHLKFYGWEGDQFSISDQIKPVRADRNVNVDELAAYVRTNASWLNITFRVGGDLPTLRRLIAAGIPVMVEETFYLAEEFWFKDDKWSGHYLLLTGYDLENDSFIAQDSFVGPDQVIQSAALDKNWQAFNRVYIVLYPPDQAATVQEILGNDWDEAANRQKALQIAQEETEQAPQNPYAWFNLGSNLTYFERYEEASRAYDTARSLPLPQRMLRYQFGPFLAYFHAGRIEDLNTIADYALKVTPNSEEALLWKGWTLYRLGQPQEARSYFEQALTAHPGYVDAQYALNFLNTN